MPLHLPPMSTIPDKTSTILRINVLSLWNSVDLSDPLCNQSLVSQKKHRGGTESHGENTNALHPILVWEWIKAFVFSRKKKLFFQYLQIF